MLTSGSRGTSMSRRWKDVDIGGTSAWLSYPLLPATNRQRPWDKSRCSWRFGNKLPDGSCSLPARTRYLYQIFWKGFRSSWACSSKAGLPARLRSRLGFLRPQTDNSPCLPKASVSATSYGSQAHQATSWQSLSSSPIKMTCAFSLDLRQGTRTRTARFQPGTSGTRRSPCSSPQLPHQCRQLKPSALAPVPHAYNIPGGVEFLRLLPRPTPQGSRRGTKRGQSGSCSTRGAPSWRKGQSRAVPCPR